MIPFMSHAVTGSQVAADGTYTSTVTAYKSKNGKVETDKYYTAKLWVEVKDGKIYSLSLTDGAKYKNGKYDKASDKIQKYLLADTARAYCGQAATIDAVQSVDAISSASIGDVDITSSATKATTEKYYISNIKDAVAEALSGAPASSSGEPPSEGGEGTYSKTFTIEKYTATVTISVTNGVVTDISVSGGGDWTTPLTNAKNSLVGKSTPTKAVDAISSATKYSQALEDAINEALSLSGTTEAPTIISGADQTWTKNSVGGLTVRSSADFSTFTAVIVDGNTVGGSNYTAVSGSTEVTLKDSYLNTLSEGTHTLGVVSTTGTASTTFTVKAAAGTANAGEDGTYTGTVVSTLTDGDYIIVDRYSNYYDYYALGNTTAGSSGGGYGFAGVEVTVSGDTATVTDNAAIWTWNSSNNSFYNAASEKYLNLPSSMNSSNGFSNTPVTLTFYSIGGNEATVYVPSGNGGYYLDAAYPSDSKAFSSKKASYVNSNYLYSGSGVYFYKVETQEPKKDSTLTLDKDAVEISAGESAAVSATVGGCSVSGATSSDTGVATVSVSGNEITVTGVAAGTATITVSGTGNEGYNNPEEQTIIVTVEDKPIVPEHVKAYDAAAGNITLNVTGKDVTTTTTSTTPGQTVTRHANIVLLLDLTSSMSKSFGSTTRIAALRTAVESFLKALPEDDQTKVDIISYWDNNYSFVSESTGWIGFNANGRKTLLETAGALDYTSHDKSNYATDQNSALIAAGTALNNVSSNGNANYVILFTDGEPSGGSSYSSTLDIARGAVNNAKNIKTLGATVYAVGILDGADANSKMEASMKMTCDWSGKFSGVDVMMNGISSNYPNASAGEVQSDSSFAMFGGESVTVTMGAGGNNGYYLLGSDANELNEKFTSIGKTITEEITTSTTVTNHTKGVVIKDTLSDFVELTDATGKNVTVVGLDGSQYSVAVSGKEVTVTFDSNVELEKDKTYTVNIPVKPTAKAQTAANKAEGDSVKLDTNVKAMLTYRFGDGEVSESPYEQSPQIEVAKQKYTVTWLNEDRTELEKDENVAYGTIPSFESTNPAKESTAQYNYEFIGWNTDPNATEALELTKQTVTNDVTYYAIFSSKVRTYTVTWKDADGKELEKDENVAYGTTPNYDKVTPTKEETAEYTYTFDKWVDEAGKEPTAVTGDATYTATYTPAKRSYTITWVNDDGTTIDTTTVEYGVVPTHEDATKTNTDEYTYTFTGWTPEVTAVTGDATYIAVFNSVKKEEEPPQPPTPGGGGGTVTPTPTPTPDPDPVVIDEPDVPLAVPEELNGEDHVAYVQGYEDGTVRPEGNITRAETATIIYRLLTAERRDEIFTAENSFSDVDADMWFNKAVSSMSAGEYINGYPDSTFKGNNNITRAEFVAIMARFLGGEGKAEFTDVPEGHWAKDYVAIAADAGWIAGYEDGTFRPDQPITRAEAMTIMNRVLKRGVDKDSELGSFKAFPDNADSSAWYYYEVIEAANSHEYSGERPSEQWTANGIDYHYDADKYERP